jgi:hypothetical protein
MAVVGSLFFWLFPFGPSINPSDRLTLFLFVVGVTMVIAGIVVSTRFRQTHPLHEVEESDAR